MLAAAVIGLGELWRTKHSSLLVARLFAQRRDRGAARGVFESVDMRVVDLLCLDLGVPVYSDVETFITSH